MQQDTTQPSRTFNPREHLIQLKTREGSKDYLPVQYRLVWINEEVRKAIEAAKKVELEITSEIVALDLDKELEAETFVWNTEKRRSEKTVKTAKGYCVCKAQVRLRIDDMLLLGTGTKMEKAVTFDDFVEKAETGAKGRALADVGFGTQFAPDLDESPRIVDAPVDRAPGANNTTNNNGNSSRQPTSRDENAAGTITEQQTQSIQKLCQHLGKSEPDKLTAKSFAEAKRLIQGLTAEYKEARQQATAGSRQ